jgi:Ni/Fe-hydrogenase subunit HybB-like protein
MDIPIKEVYNVSHWMAYHCWYHAPNSIPWHMWIPLYFYFTGLSAGTFVISSLSTAFGLKKFKPLALPAAILAVILLGVAPLCLMLDLENPLSFYRVLVPWYFNPTSPVSWGAWLMVIYPAACLIYVRQLYKKDEKKAKIWGTITIPLAISVHAYTGFVFATIKARGLWNTALLPGYFITSAVLSGLALVILLLLLWDKIREDKLCPELLPPLCKGMIVVIIVDLFWAFSWIVILLNSTTPASVSALHIVYDPIWVIGEIIFGMLVPLLLLVHSKTRNKPVWIGVASVLIMIGVLLMRSTLTFIGFNIPLS